MQVVLVMFKADGQRRSFSLPRDVTVMGRREDCDLRIPLGEVSRKHCRFIKEGESLRLEDLGSSNGTYLNGRRVQETVINPGDTVQVGPVVFVVQIDGAPAEEEMQPVTQDAAKEDTATDAVLDPEPARPRGDSMSTLSSEEQALAHLTSEDSAQGGSSIGAQLQPPPQEP